MSNSYAKEEISGVQKTTETCYSAIATNLIPSPFGPERVLTPTACETIQIVMRVECSAKIDDKGSTISLRGKAKTGLAIFLK